MKIHGTAKGGAESKKDFGVAFGGGNGNGGCSNFEDSLGTDANGTNSGSTINTSDQKLGDGCVSFDGVNNYIAIDGIAATSAFSTNVGSISLWINSADEARDDTFFGWGDTNAQKMMRFRSDGTTLTGSWYSGGHQWEFTKSGVLTADTWVSLMIVQDGTEVEVYVNNSTTGVVWDSETDRSKWVDSAMDNFRAGCTNKNSAGNTDFFKGKLDDFAIWDVAINSTTRDYIYNSGDGRKISQLGTAGSDTTCDNIKAYYNCDEFDNSTLTNNAVPV